MIPPKSRYFIIISIILTIFAIIFRISYINRTNYDMTAYNLLWYNTLADQGIAKALATDFSNYNPPYTYLLALATLTRNFLPPLIAIKLIPTAFDLLGAILIYKITNLKYKGGAPFLAASLYFSAPSVMLNSSFWGQADSIYTSMLLASLYFVLKERPAAAMATFGVSLATKAQAIFFIPFLGVLFLQKRIHWKYSFVTPVVYLLSILPVVLLGRPFLETLFIYANQANTLKKLSANAPNLYYLFPYDVYERVLPFGLVIAVILIPLWIFSSAKNAKSSNSNLLLYSFISTTLTPFILPKMHDRYFYPADVFSILLAFYNPSYWFAPILYQFMSTVAISVFLFNGNILILKFAGILNSILIAFFLREQWKLEGQTTAKPVTASIISWLIALLIPLVVLGTSARAIFTPLYFRVEYNIQNLLNEPQLHPNYDLIVKASNVTKYLTSDRETQFLTKLNFLDEEKMFAEEELSLLQNAKKEFRVISFYKLIVFLSLYLIVLFVWAKNWPDIFHHGIKKGAWITMGLGLVFLFPALFWINDPQGIFMFQIFSGRFWQDAVITISALTTGAGVLIAFIARSISKKL